jgi:hypothetical protein
MIYRIKSLRAIARSVLLVSSALSIPHFRQIAPQAATRVEKEAQVRTAVLPALQGTSAPWHLSTQSTALKVAIVAGKGGSTKPAAQHALQEISALLPQLTQSIALLAATRVEKEVQVRIAVLPAL